MQLERMDEFFERRLEGYEEHMLEAIEGAAEFYPYTASLLPMQPGCEVLDLGCGTGLELDAYFRRNEQARVTGIDLSAAMLEALRAKHPHRALTLVNASYLDCPLGTGCFDAAVSVESLHHFPLERKQTLYAALCRALKPGGYFVLTDYFAESAEHETQYFSELARLKRAQGLGEDAFYHYDTPLTLEHEVEALRTGGFTVVELKRRWANTATLLARR